MAEERASKRIETHDGASSSSTPPGSEYQVFLSFRGQDTRKGFTDHLYCNLTAAGIRTFRDKEELRVGEQIRPDLLNAIERSTISIPIFSKGYASSKWCLMELTHMVKCMNSNTSGHKICPVFNDVTPSDVRRQTGSFHEAFLQHTEKLDEPVVQEWKEALKQVADLKGWEKDKFEDGHEGKLVDKIVTEVCIMLKKGNVYLTGDLVGMDHHIEEMTKLLDINSGSGVRIVGIHGMGGMGKTTIAKYMYNQLCDHFQRQCSFLGDVRENVERKGIAELQKQLISDVLKRSVGIALDIQHAFRNKKVLIVLDDVKDKSQLKEIIGSRDYFGSGSRIIVTTRNKEVFEQWEGDIIYKPSGMNDDESLLLFCKHAFKSTQPQEGYKEISREVVETAAGLPLSLVVVGSMLFRKKIEKWEATLKKLKTIPADDVQKRLKISYDTLSNNQKQMFLDIAWHFIGEDKTNAVYMWEDCGFSPEFEGIDVLVSLSLITMEKYRDIDFDRMVDVFRMHDHLRDLGRDIVKQENPIALERSRLVWSFKEAVGGLKNQSGRKKVETLDIKYEDGLLLPNFNCFSNDDFKGMSELRYLHLDESSNLEGDFNRLLPELRWFRCGLNKIALTNFCPQKLVILDLSYSSGISDGWEKQLQPLSNLKVLDLSYCRRLTKTPDFSKFLNLERLILQSCDNLTKIDSSVENLKRLTYFNAKDCPCLRKLPPEYGSMAALQQVFLGNSFLRNEKGISELLESTGLLTQLQCLSLKGRRSLVKITESLWNLKSLVELDCTVCESLGGEVPRGIGRLTSLTVLDLSHAMVDMLPEDVGSLCNLRTLNLCNSAIKKLPKGIERLQKLEELDCSMCRSLEGVPQEGIWSLSSLRLLDFSSCSQLTGGLPKDISGMSHLETLDLLYCKNLRLSTEGLRLPLSLTRLVIPFTEASLDSVSSLVNLRHLEFYKSVGGGYCCESVEEEMVDMPNNLEVLKMLRLDDHMKSCCVPPAMKFDSSSRLRNLHIFNCSLGTLRTGLLDLSNCQMLGRLEIFRCDETREIADFGKLGSTWEHIDIIGCDSLQVLPNLSTMKRLKALEIIGCPELREIKGLEEVLTSLEDLIIADCPLLKKDELHPDLLTSESLKIKYWEEESGTYSDVSDMSNFLNWLTCAEAKWA